MKKGIKCKIVLDTNCLVPSKNNDSDNLISNVTEDTFNFIKGIKDVQLCMPQMVIDERISQILIQIRGNYDTFNSTVDNIETLSPFGIKKRDFSEKKYRRILNERFKDIIKKYQIEVIPTPIIGQDVLIERSLKRVVPYSPRLGDKGFKDTVIWLSLLRDAKSNLDFNYILFSNNSQDFMPGACKKEFQEYSSSKFEVFNTLSEIEEYLDKELNLKLDIKKRNEEIEQEILSLVGTITVKVVQSINSKLNTLRSTLTAESVMLNENYSPYSISTVSGYNTKAEGDFNFHNLTILNISERNNNIFNITARFEGIEPKKESNIWNDFENITFGALGGNRNVRSYDINFTYIRNSQDISNVSVSRGRSYMV